MYLSKRGKEYLQPVEKPLESIYLEHVIVLLHGFTALPTIIVLTFIK